VSGPISGGETGPGPGDDHVNVFRAVVIIVAGVVVGILLLNVASRPPKVPAGSAAATTTTTSSSGSTTTAGGHHSTTTTLTTSPPSSVTVQVANGTHAPNGAGYYTSVLQRQGWKTQAPLDTTSPVAASTVYYAAGQKGDAETIASELGLSRSAVQPLTSSVPVNGVTGVDVVVIVGNDLATAMSTTTTTA
jgi:hypothetical protein